MAKFLNLTSFVGLMSAVFLLSIPAKHQVQAQVQKCNSPVDISSFEKSLIDYVIVYNISSAAKAEQSCYDIVENNNGPTDDTASFNFKMNGVAVKRTATITVTPAKTGTLVFQDSPDQPLSVFGELRPNGVAVMYVCDASGQQNILVAYKNTQPELAAACDDVAKEMAAGKNAADYKVPRDNC